MQLFPAAVVTGTNREDSLQYAYCEAGGLRMAPSIDKIKGPVDLVFASEYFEHIERPIEHLTDIVMQLHPACMVVANSFATQATGHFLVYRNGPEKIAARRMGRRFNSRLQEMFYSKRKTGFWNDRPAVWERTK